jgi:CheY-like chemotaxis protein
LDDELRMCLAAIVGFAVLLDSDDAEARRDASRRIVSSVQHLSELLQRLTATDTASEAQPRDDDEPQAQRILVVDENPVSRGLLKRMLPPGFELLEAEDDVAALELAGMDNVQFVVLAWRATAFSGPETLAELKIKYPNLSVMVIAEADDDTYETVARSLGADQFLTHPLNSLKLLAASDELLASAEGPSNSDESGGANIGFLASPKPFPQA